MRFAFHFPMKSPGRGRPPVRTADRRAAQARLRSLAELLESARAEFLSSFEKLTGRLLKLVQELCREAVQAGFLDLLEAAQETERVIGTDRLRASLDRLLERLRGALSGPHDRGGRRRLVLLVEDDELLSLVMKRVLVREGFTVEIYESPEAASVERERPYVLAVADVRAPAVRATAFVRRLRHRLARRKTPVLILALPEDGPGAPWGADAVLYKPFTTREFLEAVRRLARRPAVRRRF